MKYKKVNPNVCDSQKRTAVDCCQKSIDFLVSLDSVHSSLGDWHNHEAKRGKKYPQQYANYVEEYARDTVKFQKKYGGTLSYEHPNPGKSQSFFFFFFLPNQSAPTY